MTLKKILIISAIAGFCSFASARDLPEIKSEISMILKGLNSTSGNIAESQIARKFWLSSPYGESYPCVIEMAQAKKTTIKYKVTENNSTKHTFDLRRVKNVSVVDPLEYTLRVEAEENRIKYNFDDFLGVEARIQEMVSDFRYDVTAEAAEAAEEIARLLNEAVDLCR